MRRNLLCFLAGLVLGLGLVPAAERAGVVTAAPGPSGAAGATAAAGPPLAGVLPNPDAWRAYKARFVSPEGRVIDDGNGGISHSEGQGYAMLLAVAADDRDTFSRLWRWTEAELLVRADGLAAWRWEPNRSPRVTDRNNATDGDLLIAWALVEAAEAWGDPAHRAAGRRLARAVGRAALLSTAAGPALKPAALGFGPGDRPDGPVVNLSYWVFPAFERLRTVAPDVDWKGVAASGLSLLERSRFGPAHLPSEWVALGGAEPAPAQKFPAVFGYNAVRVPLYLAWAGAGDRHHLAPFLALWGADGAKPAVVDVNSGRPVEPLRDAGYRALAALTRCAMEGARFPDDLRGAETELYYPTTLRLLALVAVRQRFGECW